jgi:hypothetical protein
MVMYNYDRRITTIEVDLPADCEGVESLLAYLRFLQYLGSVGASRALEVEDHGVITGWDGDGSDRILAIRQDGKEVEGPGLREKELLEHY